MPITSGIAMPRLLAALLLAASTLATAQAPAPTARTRGTVEKADAASLVVKLKNGEAMTYVYADNFVVSEVLPVEPAMLQAGTFIGTAAVPGADGSLSALEVLVFPEAARGTGEGHGPWDSQPGATMTNATVSSIAAGNGARTMTLRYKDGEKTIRVPDGVPIVTVKPGDRSLLVPGAKLMVISQVRGGQPTALRVLAGRDGFEPPM